MKRTERTDENVSSLDSNFVHQQGLKPSDRNYYLHTHKYKQLAKLYHRITICP